MTRIRQEAERAAGKLVSAIQKEWSGELGEPAEASLDVMNLAMGLLRAARDQRMEEILAGRSVASYLGTAWVAAHPSIVPAIQALDCARVADTATRQSPDT